MAFWLGKKSCKRENLYIVKKIKVIRSLNQTQVSNILVSILSNEYQPREEN